MKDKKKRTMAAIIAIVLVASMVVSLFLAAFV